MRLLRRLDARDLQGPGHVAAIGSFDGIHRGHRVLIDRAIALAAQDGLSSMVITFEPLPREFFFPADPPARLTSFRDRWRLLERQGPGQLCVLHFNEQLRSLTPVQFAGLLTGAGVRRRRREISRCAMYMVDATITPAPAQVHAVGTSASTA